MKKTKHQRAYVAHLIDKRTAQEAAIAFRELGPVVSKYKPAAIKRAFAAHIALLG